MHLFHFYHWGIDRGADSSSKPSAKHFAGTSSATATEPTKRTPKPTPEPNSSPASPLFDAPLRSHPFGARRVRSCPCRSAPLAQLASLPTSPPTSTPQGSFYSSPIFTGSKKTCKRHGVPVEAYLRDLLTRLPSTTNAQTFATLTPASIAAARSRKSDAA